MAVVDILTDPDPRLRATCAPIGEFGNALVPLLTDLRETLAASGAIGLSAPQIGAAKRVIIVDVPGDGRGSCVYINPEVQARRGFAIIEESCLSVPGVEGRVRRAAQVLLSYQDEDGHLLEAEIDGLHAVCVQHEIDHLDGVLFTERLSWWKRRRLRRAAA